MDCAAVDAAFATMLQDEASARQRLQEAWLAAEGDQATRCLLSAAALLGYGADFADFRALQTWIDRFSAAAQTAPDLNRTIDSLRVDAASVQLTALTHDHPLDAPATQAAAARLFEALRQGQWPGGSEHLMLAKLLYEYHGLQDDEQRCDRVAALVGHGAAAAPSAPDWQLRWMLLLEYCLDYWGHPAAAAELRKQAHALADEHPQPAIEWGMAVADLRVALRESDIPAQDRLYATMDRLRLQVRPGLAVRGLFWQASVLMRRTQFGAALAKLDLLLSLCVDVEVPLRDRGLYFELRAYALAGLQRWDEAQAQAQALAQHQSGGQLEMARTIAAALCAARALAEGAPQAHDLALQAVRLAAAQKWQRLLVGFPHWAAQLAQIALDAGVEVEFTTAMVRARRLAPPDPHRGDWPWRLRVWALGPLRLERDGHALAASGKAQRKPLDLLALLAAQGGRPLAASVVMDELWPSLEAEAPRASLDMALSRLRKLLDLPDAVRWADGQLMLDPQCVWTDVAAFDARCEQVEAHTHKATTAEAAMTDALALYTAPLLGSQPLTGMAHSLRQRLAQRHTRLVQRQCALWLSRGQGQAAEDLLERALQLDPLAEPLHRELMAAQLQRGEPVLALRSFAACEAALKQGLGAAPSSQTQALASAARARTRR